MQDVPLILHRLRCPGICCGSPVVLRCHEALSFWERLLGPQHPADRIFDGADLDRDGRLDRRELAQYMMQLGTREVVYQELSRKIRKKRTNN